MARATVSRIYGTVARATRHPWVVKGPSRQSHYRNGTLYAHPKQVRTSKRCVTPSVTFPSPQSEWLQHGVSWQDDVFPKGHDGDIPLSSNVFSTPNDHNISDCVSYYKHVFEQGLPLQVEESRIQRGQRRKHWDTQVHRLSRTKHTSTVCEYLFLTHCLYNTALASSDCLFLNWTVPKQDYWLSFR